MNHVEDNGQVIQKRNQINMKDERHDALYFVKKKKSLASKLELFPRKDAKIMTASKPLISTSPLSQWR